MMSLLGRLLPAPPSVLPQMDDARFVAFHAVQHAVHQRQAARAGHQFHADEGFVALEDALLFVEVVEVVGAGLDPGVGGDQEAGGAGGRVLHVSPACGSIRATMLSISGRGVKYWPAPDLVSVAFFSSRPS